MEKISAVIKGVGGFVPENKLTNFDLEKMIDTTDDWIKTRTGIEQRGILNEPNKASAEMGYLAIQNLISKTGLKATEIDCIICATVTPDMHFPATANIIAYKIGATNAFGYDVNAACCGFLFALTTGASMIESGRYKKNRNRWK